ncbi:flavodoxin family protein [Bermanella marisrubri]|uniref:Putative NAD(P)H oxidoreductase n=1 Tax=Bermanella marisrubri TaxID=207949 RepID=Q1MZA3_9GAMM|nr:NAD(P)H-dependent oxidoreductase [Bermanella marisrubri]EAT11363.1 putative NAD(P)H oxidoreductase [Oceanobacter sp. RED65] [Bermanella marisrubri]QIZ85251.1 flavodoxin family protein [Bermanella marisrubri]
MAKVLLLFAHPSQGRSEVNVPLYQSSEMPGVTCIDLYAEYPDFRINIDREQQRLLEHDVVIFMFPLYWYSTPSLLKEWQDLVLEYGFAYGKEGKALEGKHFFCAITAGGAEVAYQTDGYNHFTILQLLQPLEQTAYLTKMNYLPPFALFSSRTAKEDGRLQQHISEWQMLLKALVEETLDIQACQSLAKLNDWNRDLGGASS